MKKKSRLQFGIFILILAIIIGFYEYRLKQYKGIDMVWVYSVKKDKYITKGTEIDSNMFDYVQRDKNSIPTDYLKTEQELKNRVALENLYPYDVATGTKAIDKKKWDEGQDRYDSLTSGDSFGGADIRPGDKVNIFMYDTVTQQYKIEAENVEIIDVKNQDLISYMDSTDAKFSPYAIYFKKDDTSYKNMIDKSYNPSTKIRVSIQGNRPKIQKNKKQDNSGLMNVK